MGPVFETREMVRPHAKSKKASKVATVTHKLITVQEQISKVNRIAVVGGNHSAEPVVTQV